jgi:hypothetical protein
MRASRAAVLLAGLSLLQAPSARASFHLVLVTEVFPGFVSAPAAQYVELQMYAEAQNFVLGQTVQVFDAGGSLVGVFTFGAIAPIGSNQATLLIATAEAESVFGVSSDLLMAPVIDPAGGMVCFTGSTDCVSWGDYQGPVFGSGNPFSPAGLPQGQSAQRRLDRGVVGILDEQDDTNDSATDFAAAPPTPRNNLGQSGAVAGYGSAPPPSGTIDFGAVVTGSSRSATLTVQETGGRTLTVTNPQRSGTHPGDFSVDTAFPLSIADGAPPRTVQLTCTPRAEGLRTAKLTLTTSDPARPSVVYDLRCTGQLPPPPLDFFTVTPCRAIDTRSTGNPVVAGVQRTFAITRLCGVPTTARAVSLNVTVTQPSQAGNLRVFPAGSTAPLVSTLNYVAGQNRANNVVVGLDDQGRLAVLLDPSGYAHVIIDVNGYFR